MTTTTVVCLKRKGNRTVQDCQQYIGRRVQRGGWDLPQSDWHNPFSVWACGSAEVAVQKFRAYIMRRPDLLARLPELRGKTLGCWCKKDAPCHGRVLVELLETLHPEPTTDNTANKHDNV